MEGKGAFGHGPVEGHSLFLEETKAMALDLWLVDH